jgi:hypothetical protein
MTVIIARRAPLSHEVNNASRYPRLNFDHEQVNRILERGLKVSAGFLLKNGDEVIGPIAVTTPEIVTVESRQVWWSAIRIARMEIMN